MAVDFFYFGMSTKKEKYFEKTNRCLDSDKAIVEQAIGELLRRQNIEKEYKL